MSDHFNGLTPVPDHAALLRAALDLPEVRALVEAMKGIRRQMDYPQHFDAVVNRLAEDALAALEAKP
jgi:hypothetical protein